MIAQSTIDPKELRKFGLLMAVFIPILASFVAPKIAPSTPAYAPYIIALGFGSLALLLPRSLRGLYVGWMAFGTFMGKINTKIFLTLLYFFFLVPYALVLRLLGREILNLKFDSKLKTYKVYDTKSRPITHMERPY